MTASGSLHLGVSLADEAPARWIQRMAMHELEDNECVMLCREGDKRAFAELVRRYQDRIYRFLYRMLGSREEALELAQETFLKAFQGLGTWQPTALFRTWLFQIASNTALDTLRRRRLVAYVSFDVQPEFVDGAPGPETQAALAQQFRDLEALLRRLVPDQREALLLREIEDMTYSEIAEVLGISEGTVKSRIARARAALLLFSRETD